MSSRENARIKKETEKLKEDTENARNQQRIEADRLRTATSVRGQFFNIPVETISL